MAWTKKYIVKWISLKRTEYTEYHMAAYFGYMLSDQKNNYMVIIARKIIYEDYYYYNVNNNHDKSH